MAGEALEHPTGERARTAGVRLALLIELVHGRDRPSGARGERDGLRRVRHQARVARRSADVRRGRDLVVDLEDREDRRQADPEPHRLLEPAERDRLHEGDAGVDHDGERDGLDAGGGEASRGLGGGVRRPAAFGPTAGRRPSDSEQLQVLRPLPVRHRVADTATARTGASSCRPSRTPRRRTPSRPDPVRARRATPPARAGASRRSRPPRRGCPASTARGPAARPRSRAGRPGAAPRRRGRGSRARTAPGTRRACSPGCRPSPGPARSGPRAPTRCSSG